MRIICDAPGQTCNRLWSYVASIAECVVEKRKMIILFFDYTIEDFPNFKHCPFIYFPLYNQRFLEHGNRWNQFKSLTWKATHNHRMDQIFKLLGCTKGWFTRRDMRYIQSAKKKIQFIFQPKDSILRRIGNLLKKMKAQSDIVVGVHIRRGDYASWHNGKYLFSFSQYRAFMERVIDLYPDKRVSFFVCSNEKINLFNFNNLSVFLLENTTAIEDLYMLSICDQIMGPISTFSRWASFIGEKPLCFLERADQQIKKSDFSVIVDFFHFKNGIEIPDI